LIETVHRHFEIDHSVKTGSLGFSSGDSLAEAEQQFEQATISIVKSAGFGVLGSVPSDIPAAGT
jgi:hypothetical protein